jgi:regulation of enolase protein 1 (concanavalin A-like superfamily)
MFSVDQKDSIANWRMLPNILGQKTVTDEFTATTRIQYNFRHLQEEMGLIILGMDYAAITIKKKKMAIILFSIVV